jgi:integrase
MSKRATGVHFIERGGFRVYVGRVLKGDELQRKCWYLGHHEAPAQRLADFIKQEWKRLKALGVDHFTTESLERIEAFREGRIDSAGVEQVSPGARVSGVEKAEKQKTTHQAIEDFRRFIETDIARSRHTRKGLLARLDSLKKLIPDAPLKSMGVSEVQGYVDHYKALPISKSTGKRISVLTARDMIQLLRMFFDWCDSRDLWVAPRRFETIFNVKYHKIRTENGINGNEGVKVWKVAELHEIWKAGSESERLYLLLMLNCGFTSMDMAMLELGPQGQSEFVDVESYGREQTILWTKGKQWVIAGRRTKTGVYGRFPLWQETTDLLRKRLKGTVRDGETSKLAILSERGNPLIHWGTKAHTDSVGLALRRLIKELAGEGKIRRLNAKALRKTGAQLIRDMSSEEIAQCYLRHTAKTVSGKYYTNPNYAKVAQCLKTLRAKQLDGMFTGKGWGFNKR